MKAYLRKLHNHDLTHEVSVQSYYVWTFFDANDSMSFYNVNSPSKDYSVIINDVTDPRFGGQFKAIYRAEGPRVGNFLLIRKLEPRRYSLELIKSTSSKYAVFKAKFDCNNRVDRHSIIDI